MDISDSGGRREEDLEPAEEDSNIEFVFHSDPAAKRNKASRRLVHRHAMKAIGKTRRRVRSPKVVELDISALAPCATERQLASWWLGVRWAGVSSGGVDPFLRYPVQLDATARGLLANVFRAKGGQRPLRDAWFGVALQDEAAFFVTLANSALHQNALQRKAPWGRETDESLHYSSMAMASIRRRINQPISNVIEYIIGAVSGLLANAALRGDRQSWLIHHNGFLNLVKLRGGIEMLEANEMLRITVSWCELRGAIMQDMEPACPLPSQWMRYTEAPPLSEGARDRLNHLFPPRTSTSTGYSQWMMLFRDLLSFSESTFSRGTMMDSSPEFGAWTNPMIHRLLSWRPNRGNPIPEQAALEACRIAALLFLSRVWRFFGVRPVISDFLVDKLVSVMKICEGDWGVLEQFQTWVLCLCSMEVRGKSEAIWAVEQMHVALDQAGEPAKGVLECLKEILWYECLFTTSLDDTRLDSRIGFIMENLPEDFFVTSFQFTEHTYRDQYPAINATKNSELSLDGKVVIITGASRGIGARGFVPEFAKAGPKAIVLAARDATRLESVAAEVAKINPTVETLIAPTDIGSSDSIKGLYAKVAAKYGHADILINNAAVNTIQGNLADVDPEAWWNSFAINARGTLLATSYFLKALPATSHGTIVNLTTGMGWGVYPGSSSYALSKMINLQMAAYVGAESAGNVTSVALHPGLVKTDMTQEAFRPFAQDTPALVGGTALWLCQDKARFLNGKTVCANWSMDDLYARRAEIVKEGLLNIDLKGKFGAEQFQK